MTPKDVLVAKAEELAGTAFDCNCGRHHAVDIKLINVEKDISTFIAHFVKKRFHGKKVMLVSDGNTYPAQGFAVEKSLASEGITLTSFVFEGLRQGDNEVLDPGQFNTSTMLVPDEKAVGDLLVSTPRDCALIIGIGSGTINDLCRFVSDRMKIPYAIVCTAPSVDGYASTVSPLIIKGRKTTLEACYPLAIFADPQVLENAPIELIHAGLGDMLGKITALADWELSRRVEGEYHCQVIEQVVRRALDECCSNVKSLSAKNADACTELFNALALSGLAMGMVGNSRPASGAEHHMAHYWEMDALRNGVPHALHGSAVGVATVVVATLYEALRDRLPGGFVIPSSAKVLKILNEAGAPAHPADIGISRELFHKSLLEAMNVRPRYTILRLADSTGCLNEMAEVISEKYYGF